jgi:hypothetical protein
LSKVVLRATNSMLPNASYGCHIFPPGRQLPALQQFMIGADPTAGDDLADEPEDLPLAFLEDLSLSRMAASCPALEVLVLPGCLEFDVPLTPLLQLTALTDLFIGGEEIDDTLVEQQLAMLTGLRSLQVCDVVRARQPCQAAGLCINPHAYAGRCMIMHDRSVG